MTTETASTRLVPASELDDTMVLVGDAGGHSAIYTTARSSAMPGLLVVETEHGPLYLDPDHDYTVLADQPTPTGGGGPDRPAAAAPGDGVTHFLGDGCPGGHHDEVVEDGFGSTWVKCAPGCELQVVRPGKVQCSCDDR